MLHACAKQKQQLYKNNKNTNGDNKQPKNQQNINNRKANSKTMTIVMCPKH